MQDYYSILKISPKASEIEIHRAYKNLEKKKEEMEEEEFNEITAAYNVLKNDDKKWLYDRGRKGELMKGSLRPDQSKIFKQGLVDQVNRNKYSANLFNRLYAVPLFTGVMSSYFLMGKQLKQAGILFTLAVLSGGITYLAKKSKLKKNGSLEEKIKDLT